VRPDYGPIPTGHGTPPGPLVLGNTHPALRRAWHPVARFGDIGTEPIAVKLLGEHWVVYRVPGGGADEVVAFVDRCPHRLAPLSIGSLEAAGLRCGYHGWCFDPSGRIVDIPALGPGAALPPRARLTPAAGVRVRYGTVWLAPEAPITPPPDFGVDLTSLAIIDLPVLDARASAGLLADNFLDIAHFPFVHKATFGAEESKVVVPYDVRRDGWGFDAGYTHAFAHREDPGVAAGIRPLLQKRRMTYQYRAPLSLMLRLDYLDSGGINVIGFFLQPLDESRCRIWSSLWRDDIGGDPARAGQLADFEVAVINEDLRLQATYRDLTLPLDPTVEVHTRADRTTLELRRILAELVRAAAAGPSDGGEDAAGPLDESARADDRPTRLVEEAAR
jgi:phenylpropionate dioxygenase-like ring-hydroxylating dioxygenase large terminal subunit